MAYMTDEERAAPLVHYAEGLTFSCDRLDLKTPVTVSHYNGPNFINHQRLATSMACFMAWWILNVHPRLNGFSGVDCIRWKFD